MRNRFRFVALTLPITLGLGCLDVTTIVKVNTDGSGTVEETVVMSRHAAEQLMEMLQSMAAQFGASETADETFSLFNEATIRDRANQMGEGVTFVSSHRFSNEKGEGYEALFAFDDIQKVRLNQNPGDRLPSGGMPVEDNPAEEWILFQLARGTPATLRIQMPEPKLDEDEPDLDSDDEALLDPEEDGSSMDVAMGGLFEEMFRDFQMHLAIEVDGTLLDTNATFREGNRITILQFDFSQIMKDAERFKELTSTQPSSLEAAKALLKDIPGVKIDLNPELWIRFQ